jgi:hypothetical protein
MIVISRQLLLFWGAGTDTSDGFPCPSLPSNHRRISCSFLIVYALSFVGTTIYKMFWWAMLLHTGVFALSRA